MNEDFLYYLWQYKLMPVNELVAVNNAKIVLKDTGNINNFSGPDFLNAQIFIDEQLWAGNVEMHLKSSDWYLHKHEQDVNYDNVILHVVWENDVDIFMKNNEPLPTLELKNIIHKKLIHDYKSLFLSDKEWISCEKQIKNVDKFLINNWLERLYFERLENKSSFINDVLKDNNFDFEATLFQLLAKNFGLKVNGDAFFRLAKSVDFSIIRKLSFNEKELSALFFGQAGFLEEDFQNSYQKELSLEYNYLKHKYDLVPLSKNNFQFFRMRPSNFPTIRIAQLVTLVNKNKGLFSKVLECKSLEDFYMLFSIEVNEFWKTHYTFSSKSKKSKKKITKSFINLLLINTIIPLKFVYSKYVRENFEETTLDLISEIKPEKNNIVTRFYNLNIKAKNALQSQSLLELKYNYCDKKRCLKCAVGNRILRG